MNAGESLGLIGVVLAIGFAIGKRSDDTTPSLPPPISPPLAPPIAPDRPPLPPMGGGGSLSPVGGSYRQGQKEIILRQEQGDVINEEIIEDIPQKGVDLDAIPEKPVDDSFKFDGMYKI